MPAPHRDLDLGRRGGYAIPSARNNRPSDGRFHRVGIRLGAVPARPAVATTDPALPDSRRRLPAWARRPGAQRREFPLLGFRPRRRPLLSSPAAGCGQSTSTHVVTRCRGGRPSHRRRHSAHRPGGAACHGAPSRSGKSPTPPPPLSTSVPACQGDRSDTPPLWWRFIAGPGPVMTMVLRLPDPC